MKKMKITCRDGVAIVKDFHRGFIGEAVDDGDNGAEAWEQTYEVPDECEEGKPNQFSPYPGGPPTDDLFGWSSEVKYWFKKHIDEASEGPVGHGISHVNLWKVKRSHPQDCCYFIPEEWFWEGYYEDDNFSFSLNRKAIEAGRLSSTDFAMIFGMDDKELQEHCQDGDLVVTSIACD